MNKIFILLITILPMMAFSLDSNGQVPDIDKLKARKEILKKTSELNALQIKLNDQMKAVQKLRLQYEKVKSEAHIYETKNSSKIGADVKAASKIAKLTKKSTVISGKITKNNIQIEKLKSKIEKLKSKLEKLNGRVIIYTKGETPFGNDY